ncbi:MAG: hypothetical protein HYY50_01140 [Candidatus Kerfeldbacteria bacterium]|nr:hypothetical protein [Candidatus Kerfeldbacteria bacterium]
MPYLPKILPTSRTPEPTPPKSLTPSVSRMVETLAKQSSAQIDEDVPKIEVHDTVSNVAWAYEKLRQAIDYQDEHLLRKNAIERILRRRLTSGVTAEQLADPLVLELIRGRYLPNNTLPTTVIQQAEEIINRYIHLWSAAPTQPNERDQQRLFDWYLGLLAVQLNELFTPPTHDEALVHLMFHVTHRDIAFAEGEMGEAEKNTQLYVAIHRALLKSDSNIIRFHLFLRQHPEWQQPSAEVIQRLGRALPQIRQHIESQLLHPAGELLQRLMKKYTIIFLLLGDIIKTEDSAGPTLLSQPDELVETIATAYAGRRKTVTWKIARNVIRSIIYVFLTKMLLTLVIEVPVDRLFFGQNIDYTPLIINTVFPPLLLLLIGITIRPPGRKNEQAVMAKVQDLVYRGDERHALVKPRKPIRRSALFTAIYRIVYGLTFFVVFGFLIAMLTYYHFTPVSTFIFLLFLTIVSFFGIRVRLLAKELLVVDQRENIFTVLFDFLTVPILQVGRWIALRAPKINVFIFFLDVIIEAPFKAFLEATEGFLGFLREKREEIY